MSVSYRLFSVHDHDILDIIKDPIKLQILHSGKEDKIYLQELCEDLDEEEQNEFLSWDPVSAKPQVFFIDAAADSISYLLTNEIDRNKTSFPLNFLNCERIGIGEIGWGKANFYTSGDVLLISKALNNLDHDVILNRYDPGYFNEHKIYPSGYNWRQTDGAELLQKIKELTIYVNKITGQGLGFYIVAV